MRKIPNLLFPKRLLKCLKIASFMTLPLLLFALIWALLKDKYWVFSYVFTSISIRSILLEMKLEYTFRGKDEFTDLTDTLKGKSNPKEIINTMLGVVGLLFNILISLLFAKVLVEYFDLIDRYLKYFVFGMFVILQSIDIYIIAFKKYDEKEYDRQ